MSPSSASVQSAQRSSEPSMEEILASIRKIIADDQKVLEAKASSGAPQPDLAVLAQDDDEDILDLELATETREPVFAQVAMPQAPAQTRAAPQPVPSPAPQPRRPDAARLMSDQAASAATTAFQSLANTVFSPNSRTMDEVVAEMLRPMLKGWLDENLPGLVERLVRAEIERVSRGGR